MARKDVTDRMVLEAIRDRARPTDTIALLMERSGQPEKVCEAAMERAEKRGLIDYGVSLRTAWTTEKGVSFLKDAQGPS